MPKADTSTLLKQATWKNQLSHRLFGLPMGVLRKLSNFSDMASLIVEEHKTE